MRILAIILLLLFGGLSSSAFSMDEIKVVPGQSENDSRLDYGHRILQAALDATVENDGPYKFVYASDGMARNRALVELKTGNMINVYLAATRDEWEQQLIPIRIPVLKGLLGYRLFLIKRSAVGTFENLKTIEELKKLRAGLGGQWSTTAVMQALGFSIVTGTDYEGLFGMLDAGRFDYFPRGINEIYKEFEARKTLYPEMIIEPTKALYFTTPSYFFVSPQYPDLAARIKRGLLIIFENGVLDTEFNREFGDDLAAANLANRTILKVENKYLSSETPLEKPEFWFVP